MSSSPKNFSHLIDPVSVDTFKKVHWRKKHLHLERDEPKHYDNILQQTDVEDLLNSENLSPELIRVFKGDVWKNAMDFSVNKAFELSSALIADNGKLKECFADGYSIEFNLMEYLIPRSSSFINALLKEVRIPAVAKLFITPPNAQGIRTHFDDEENFILQIAGTKQWTLYPPLYESPIKSMRHLLGPEHLGEALETVHLKAGDLLYVPAGVIHDVKTREDVSIHITIGFTAFRWFDLIRNFAMSASQNLDFRNHIPDELLNAPELKGYETNFKKQLKDLVDKIDVKELLKSQHGLFDKSLPQKHADFFLPTKRINSISLGTTLLRDHAVVVTTQSTKGQFVIETDEKRMVFPAPLKNTLAEILKKEQFQLDELSTALPEPMLLNLAKKLVIMKIVCIA